MLNCARDPFIQPTNQPSRRKYCRLSIHFVNALQMSLFMSCIYFSTLCLQRLYKPKKLTYSVNAAARCSRGLVVLWSDSESEHILPYWLRKVQGKINYYSIMSANSQKNYAKTIIQKIEIFKSKSMGTRKFPN